MAANKSKAVQNRMPQNVAVNEAVETARDMSTDGASDTVTSTEQQITTAGSGEGIAPRVTTMKSPKKLVTPSTQTAAHCLTKELDTWPFQIEQQSNDFVPGNNKDNPADVELSNGPFQAQEIKPFMGLKPTKDSNQKRCRPI